MSIECYICSREPVIRVSYRDSSGQLLTEIRCRSCSNKLLKNDDNTVESKTVLDDSYTPPSNKTDDSSDSASNTVKKTTTKGPPQYGWI